MRPELLKMFPPFKCALRMFSFINWYLMQINGIGKNYICDKKRIYCTEHNLHSVKLIMAKLIAASHPIILWLKDSHQGHHLHYTVTNTQSHALSLHQTLTANKLI